MIMVRECKIDCHEWLVFRLIDKPNQWTSAQPIGQFERANSAPMAIPDHLLRDAFKWLSPITANKCHSLLPGSVSAAKSSYLSDGTSWTGMHTKCKNTQLNYLD